MTVEKSSLWLPTGSVRALLAFITVLAGVTGGLATTFYGIKTGDSALIAAGLTPTVGLACSAIGYYFGTKK